MRIERELQSKIEEKLFSGNVIVIYGARQVGKTTLIKTIAEKYKDSLYLNCDNHSVRISLENRNAIQLKSIIGNSNLVFIDEAQRVENIGITLKLLVDTYPEVQIVATGSSAFDLANKIKEPLTGRAFEFHLYAPSVKELLPLYSDNDFTNSGILEERLIYGMYPKVVLQTQPKAEALKQITGGYLYKDLLAFGSIKHPETLDKLLRALALQLGQEVSYNELSSLLGIDKDTVSSYVRLLEQAFIIFRLPPYYTNSRTELKKMNKIYFYDNGVRNALIENLNDITLRTDIGALWENFLISERIKRNHYNNPLGFVPKAYFWRTYAGQEIDYIEDVGGTLKAFEFKWSKKKKPIAPKPWRDAYQDAEYKVISKENYLDFLQVS